MRMIQSLTVAALVGLATVPALALQEGAPQVPGQMDASRVSGGTYVTDPAGRVDGQPFRLQQLLRRVRRR